MRPVSQLGSDQAATRMCLNVQVVDNNRQKLSLCLAVGAIVSTALGVYIGILVHPIALVVLVVGKSHAI